MKTTIEISNLMSAKKAKKKKPATRPRGRPTKYKPEYCQAIIDYFDRPCLNIIGNPNDPPFFLNFCLSIGISKECMHDWVAKYPDFSDAYKIAKDKQKHFIVVNALQNRYNASFAWRMMMNCHNWREKSDNVHTGKDGKELFPSLPEKEKAILAGIFAK